MTDYFTPTPGVEASPERAGSGADPLARLNRKASLEEHLCEIHEAIRGELPFVDRVAVALYDGRADLLKTFIHSSGGDRPISHYETTLGGAPSIARMAESGEPRVVNDMSMFDEGEHEHTVLIRRQGYGASAAYPVIEGGEFYGVIFFNSYRAGVFEADAVRLLSVYAHLISRLVTEQLSRIETILASLRTAIELMHYKDPETGMHLERMAQFSRVIAQELSIRGRYDFSDEFIEYLFAFAPLHDVGKLSIPDEILLKPAKLDEEELKVMRTHAGVGRKVLDAIIRNFGFESFRYVDVLRNVAEHHHEKLDGKGYPGGLAGDDIPIESRIVAVADVFDALTTKRPYKEAWPNERAFRHMRELAAMELDPDCVDALLARGEQVKHIQVTFRDQ